MWEESYISLVDVILLLKFKLTIVPKVTFVEYCKTIYGTGLIRICLVLDCTLNSSLNRCECCEMDVNKGGFKAILAEMG